jgi:hypothetical protein
MNDIIVKKLSTGHWRAQGNGPCEWAQWPIGRQPREEDCFPEASVQFRNQLLASQEPRDDRTCAALEERNGHS